MSSSDAYVHLTRLTGDSLLLSSGLLKSMDTLPEISIVMPCLNEARTLGGCITKAQTFLKNNQILGEIIVADNGSTDNSGHIGRSHGAVVINAEPTGYGAAVMAGIRHARGQYIIMGDSDGSYDFLDLMPFVQALRSGYHLVVGNRFQGGIAKGAMPLLHKYFGNPILSYIGKLFFDSPCGDFHCGLRGLNRQSILELNLITTGMEFASEMIIKASLNKLAISELPVFLSIDGRTGRSHLRPWRDGWRHLRLLLFSLVRRCKLFFNNVASKRALRQVITSNDTIFSHRRPR